MFRTIASFLGYAGITVGLASLLVFGIFGSAVTAPTGPVIGATIALVVMGAGFASLALHAWRHEDGGPLIVFSGLTLLLAMMASYVAFEGFVQTIPFVDTMRIAWTIVVTSGIGLWYGSKMRRVPFPATH